MNNRKYTLDTVALFAAFALFLSTMEFMIPKPVPFMRIGLANLPVLLSLYLFSPLHTMLLVLLKILSQGLVNGTLFSYIFVLSGAGSLVSGMVMLLAKQGGGKYISLIGISMLGAFSSNIVQLVLSRYLVFGPSAWLIAPPFLALGGVSSFLLGLFAQNYLHNSQWLAGLGAETDGYHSKASKDLTNEHTNSENSGKQCND